MQRIFEHSFSCPPTSSIEYLLYYNFYPMYKKYSRATQFLLPSTPRVLCTLKTCIFHLGTEIFRFFIAALKCSCSRSCLQDYYEWLRYCHIFSNNTYKYLHKFYKVIYVFHRKNFQSNFFF